MKRDTKYIKKTIDEYKKRPPRIVQADFEYEQESSSTILHRPRLIVWDPLSQSKTSLHCPFHRVDLCQHKKASSILRRKPRTIHHIDGPVLVYSEQYFCDGGGESAHAILATDDGIMVQLPHLDFLLFHKTGITNQLKEYTCHR